MLAGRSRLPFLEMMRGKIYMWRVSRVSKNVLKNKGQRTKENQGRVVSIQGSKYVYQM